MGKKPATAGVPKRSPIQVLTGPDVAGLPRSNGIGSILRGMVAGKRHHILLRSLFHAPLNFNLFNQSINQSIFDGIFNGILFAHHESVDPEDFKISNTYKVNHMLG